MLVLVTHHELRISNMFDNRTPEFLQKPVAMARPGKHQQPDAAEVSHLQATALREKQKSTPNPFATVKKNKKIFFSNNGNCRACEKCLNPTEITFDCTSICEPSCESYNQWVSSEDYIVFLFFDFFFLKGV